MVKINNEGEEDGGRESEMIYVHSL